MAENRNCQTCGNAGSRETVSVDVNRILDSCRDKDCFSDTRVLLSDCGQELLERATNIRIRDAQVVGADIGVEPVQFNRGFYHVMLRFYIRVDAEACLCPGKSQELEGMAVVDKKVILYGSEGGVSIFRSTPGDSGFCNHMPGEGTAESNLPVAVTEVATPVVLDARIAEPQENCRCCCCASEIPDHISCCVGSLSDNNEGKQLLVTFGLFSVVRIERPAQYLISAAEYSVPDKECCPSEETDPCTIFRKMAFPVNEFYPPSCGRL